MTLARDTRFDPIADARWPDTIKDLRDGFAGGLNVYRTMAHHATLLRSWAPLRDHVVNGTALGPQLSEVAILRTGHRLGSSYEWQQHIDRARRRGLTDARILSIAGAVGAMAPVDRLIATAVDELFDQSALSAESVDALTEEVGKEGVFDLMATVGFYSTLGFLLNTFQTPLDDDIASRLSKAPLQREPDPQNGEN